ncbi:MAG TPA: hypothetical protein VHO25_16030 [Polyangiaceae bacterium]|nr:hypothetical protein [Polyangiaceae bacterium]
MMRVRLNWGQIFGIGLALLAVACPPSVPCETPLSGGDASGGAEYPVARLEWTEGVSRIAISYPASSSGPPGSHVEGTHVPFADDLENAPVVILLHGNGGGGGDATYAGYSYLQNALARHGITAVSIGGNPAFEWTADESVVRQVMYRLLAVPFRWRLNLQNIGMMGHSAGGVRVKNIAASPPPGMKVRAVLMLGTPGGAAAFPTVDGYLTVLPAAEGHGNCHGGASDPRCDGNPGYPDVPGAIEYDSKRPAPFDAQLYVHRANDYSWNRASLPDSTVSAVPPIFSAKHHELILRSYATAFFRAILQDMPQEPAAQLTFFRSQHGPISYLNGHRVPSLTSPASPSTGVYGATTVDPAGLVLSWRSTYLTTVDNYQQNNGATANSLGRPITSGLVMVEQDCRAGGCMGYAGRTRLLLLTAACASGAPTCPDAGYRTELGAAQRNLRERAAVLIRAGEPFERDDVVPAVPARGVSFALGLEDTSGNIQWKNADEVGGVPRPYARNDIFGRWLLKTLRFPIDCFTDVDTRSIAAIHLMPINTDPGRQIAFDDLVLE